jgi:hypothetical protein
VSAERLCCVCYVSQVVTYVAKSVAEGLEVGKDARHQVRHCIFQRRKQQRSWEMRGRWIGHTKAVAAQGLSCEGGGYSYRLSSLGLSLPIFLKGRGVLTLTSSVRL